MILIVNHPQVHGLWKHSCSSSPTQNGIIPRRHLLASTYRSLTRFSLASSSADCLYVISLAFPSTSIKTRIFERYPQTRPTMAIPWMACSTSPTSISPTHVEIYRDSILHTTRPVKQISRQWTILSLRLRHGSLPTVPYPISPLHAPIRRERSFSTPPTIARTSHLR